MPHGLDWLTNPRRPPPMQCRNSREMSCAAKELSTQSPRVRLLHYSFRVQLDFVGDPCGFGQHSGDRAVFFFRQPDSIFNSFARDISGNTIDELDLRKHARRCGSFFRLRANFDTRQPLTFLLQNSNHVIGCASAQRNQDKFHRAVPSFAVTIHRYRMARAGLAVELGLLLPFHVCLNHVLSYLRLSVLGSGWIKTRNNSGASCLNRISSAVERSCTRESGNSSGKVQWQETYTCSRTRLTLMSCMSRISGNSVATPFRRSSNLASRAICSPGSIVAGSLSICVRMDAISGTSSRISVSIKVTRSCACFSDSRSSISRCCSTLSWPSRYCTLTSFTFRLWRVATARTRSKIFSVNARLRNARPTPSSFGRIFCTAPVTSSATWPHLWKVTLRASPIETSAK